MNEVRHAVAQGVREQFGMEILDLQIPSIKYSDTFVASVEAAVKAKNNSVAAENTVNRIRYEGEQKVVTAKAEAEAAVARAQAQRQARILEAEGDARGIELRAVAEAQSIRIRGEALKDNARVIELTIAQRWNGQPPQTVLGGAGAAVPFFNIGTAAPGLRARAAARSALAVSLSSAHSSMKCCCACVFMSIVNQGDRARGSYVIGLLPTKNFKQYSDIKTYG